MNHVFEEDKPWKAVLDDSMVKEVVGQNFDELIREKAVAGTDILVMFYAPWCGHCQALSPKFESLAASLSNAPTVRLAKIDHTLNDVPGIDVPGYPHIVLFRAGEAGEPVAFTLGDMNEDSLMYFLASSAAQPFQSNAGNFGGGIALESLTATDEYLTLTDSEGLEAIVMDESKDVLLEVVAMNDGNCERCQELADGFDALAATYEGDKDLRAVMYDVALYGRNLLLAEYDTELPVVLLFARGAKDAPVRMVGDRFDTGALDHWAQDQLGRSPAQASYTRAAGPPIELESPEASGREEL